MSRLRAALLLVFLAALIPARGLGIYTIWEIRQAPRATGADHEVGAIAVVAEDPSFDPADHHVVEDTRGIQPGLTGHGGRWVA